MVLVVFLVYVVSCIKYSYAAMNYVIGDFSPSMPALTAAAARREYSHKKFLRAIIEDGDHS